MAARVSGVHLAKELAGHANIATTQGYIHVNEDECRETLGNIVPVNFTGTES